MCELLAMSFETPISADFALKAFGPRGEENPDGWGLAWYPDQSLALVKEPVKWSTSPLAGFLATSNAVQARTLLAHVRHKTIGGANSHADTHPFSRELGGRDYVFAHNGTLMGEADQLPLGAFQPIGGTDSERFFCHLLGRISERGPLDDPADWRWLHATLAEANGFGKLNVLLSDGRRLFVYHDVNGWKGLTYRRVGSPSFESEPTPGGPGVVVATYPLDTSLWETFGLGELIVFESGQVRFSSRGDRSAILDS